MKVFKHYLTDNTIITFGGLSGRLDQTIHILSQTQKLQSHRSNAIYIISENNLAISLRPGKHKLCIPNNKFGLSCGILPIGVNKASVKTDGLEWNLGGQGLEYTSFDGLISSSNHLINDEVIIETDQFIYFNVEIKF